MSITPEAARVTAAALDALSNAARPGPWRAYETVHADNFVVEASQGLLNGPGPVMGPSYDKSTVEYVVALVNAHRAGLLSVFPEPPTTDDRDDLAWQMYSAHYNEPDRDFFAKISDRQQERWRKQADRVLAAGFRRPSPPTDEREQAMRELHHFEVEQENAQLRAAIHEALNGGPNEPGGFVMTETPRRILTAALEAAARVGGAA